MHKARVALSLAGVLLAWQVVVWLQIVPETYLPGPLAAVLALWHGLRSGELSLALGLTMGRALLGLLASTALGVGLALLTARYRRLRQAFDPLAEFLRPLPPAALVPIAIFFLGLTWKLHAFIVLFACVWPVYLTTAAALKAVPLVQIRSAASFGYEGWSRVVHVQLPASMPEIFTGIRLAAAIALIAVIVTEMLAGRDGLGFALSDATMTLRIPDTFAALLLAMLSGLALNAGVLAVRDRVIAWNIGMTASNRS